MKVHWSIRSHIYSYWMSIWASCLVCPVIEGPLKHPVSYLQWQKVHCNIVPRISSDWRSIEGSQEDKLKFIVVALPLEPRRNEVHCSNILRILLVWRVVGMGGGGEIVCYSSIGTCYFSVNTRTFKTTRTTRQSKWLHLIFFSILRGIFTFPV